jgi:hypothetical protein
LPQLQLGVSQVLGLLLVALVLHWLEAVQVLELLSAVLAVHYSGFPLEPALALLLLEVVPVPVQVLVALAVH